MKTIQSSRFLGLCGALLVLLSASTGCSAKAKFERHVERADAFFEKEDYEKARIEYLNAHRLNRRNAHVTARLAEASLVLGDARSAFELYSLTKQLDPTNSAASINLGNLYLLGGDPAKAREEAEQILQRTPDNADALLLLANASLTTNDIASARERIGPLASSTSTNSTLFLALATIAQRTGDTNSAEAAFKRAVELDPDTSKNHFALGTFYFTQGNLNLADTHLKAAMQKGRVKSLERVRYVDLLIKTGRAEEAEKLLLETVATEPSFTDAWNQLTQIELARNNLEKAAEYNARALAGDPRNRDALLVSARLQIGKREFTNAISKLESLAQTYPRDSQVQFQLANAYFGAANTSRALAALDTAISLNTNNVEAVLLRSRLQIARGNHTAAIVDLERILRQFPRVSQAQYLLGAAHRGAGNLDAAAAVYTEISRIAPNDPQSHHQLGNIYRQQGKLSEARQSYNQALAIKPDYFAALDDLVMLELSARNYDAAQALIQRYLQEHPDKPLLHLFQARVFLAQNQNPEAEAAVKKAIEFDPEFILAHRTLANFYLLTRQTDQAIAKLESITQANDRDVGSLIQLGILYESKNEFDHARAAYEKVLKLSPNSFVPLNNLAVILMEREGELDNAHRYAQKAREVNPYSPYSADTLGWILWKKGDYQQALNLIQQADEGLPQMPEVLFHLGMAHYMVGSSAPAIEALTKALQATNDFNGKATAAFTLQVLQIDPQKGSPADLELLRNAVVRNPADVIAYAKIAQFHEAQSAWDKARLSYEEALARNPRSTLLLSRLAVLNAGPLNQKARALELAREAWRISQSPELAAALGPVAYAAGDFKWSYALLIEAQHSFPQNAELSYYSGLSSFAVGRLPQAREALNRAISRGLSDTLMPLARAAVQIFDFHAGSGSLPEARAAVNAALAADRTFPPAMVGSGVIAEREGDLLTARKQLEAALASHPGLLVAQRHLALVLFEQATDDLKAQNLITALRSDFPDDPELSKALGIIAYRRGDYQEASRNLRLAGSRLSNDSELLYHLGMAQYHLKDTGAKATLTRAVALEPNAPLSVDAKNAINQLAKVEQPK